MDPFSHLFSAWRDVVAERLTEGRTIIPLTPFLYAVSCSAMTWFIQSQMAFAWTREIARLHSPSKMGGRGSTRASQLQVPEAVASTCTKLHQVRHPLRVRALHSAFSPGKTLLPSRRKCQSPNAECRASDPKLFLENDEEDDREEPPGGAGALRPVRIRMNIGRNACPRPVNYPSGEASDCRFRIRANTESHREHGNPEPLTPRGSTI